MARISIIPKKMNLDINSVDEYIGNFPKEVQQKLSAIREVINENAPNASEHILYGMPAYKTFKKPLVYFAAYAKHIGFYATPTGHLEFANELKNYKHSKGSVQFPIGEPIPIELITRIIIFRVKENELNFKKK